MSPRVINEPEVIYYFADILKCLDFYVSLSTMFSLNFHGELRFLEKPLVMGIVNINEDSFYSHSRVTGEKQLKQRISEMLIKGADIIDIGACSTRPGSKPCKESDELERMVFAMKVIRDNFPSVLISIDTFRSSIVREIAPNYKIDLVNDVSGGEGSEDMFETVADLKLPYILTHSGFMFSKNRKEESLEKDIVSRVLCYLSERLKKLNYLGVSDVIIDPGFGFAKTRKENFTVLKSLHIIKKTLRKPILVGLSRKSMIWQTLNTNPDESLLGTGVLNTVALQEGADILRVHDVEPAIQSIELIDKTNE